MDPIFGLIGSIGGGLINNLFAGKRQDEAQAFAREQAATAQANFRLNRQTAYQDTMGDMKAAGLNPILAYQRGATSSTMGATPGVSAAPVSDVGIGPGIQSALAIRRQNVELENMQAIRDKTIAETDLTKSQKATEDKKPANVEANTQQLIAATGLSYGQLQKIVAEAMQATQLANWMQENPKLVQYIEAAHYIGGRAADIAAPFMDAARSLVLPNRSSSARGSKNLTGPDKDVILPGPNDYKRSRPDYQPAPPRPRGGWFDQRFYGEP